MGQNFKVAGAASLPFEDGTNVAPIDLTVNLPYTGRADFVRSYTGAVTDEVVNLGTLASAGAKGVLIKVLTGACTVKFNGGTDAWPLAVGGYFIWCNPATPFPTAVLITTLAAAQVLFIAVG
jgi:hypothetical protein